MCGILWLQKRKANKLKGVITMKEMINQLTQDFIENRDIIKKAINSKHRQRGGEKGILVHCWWECKLVQPLWKTA